MAVIPADNAFPRKILFVTSFHPEGDGFIGAGEAVCGRSLRGLLAEGNEVHVLCLGPTNQSSNPGLVSQCFSYRTLRQDWFQSALAVLHGLQFGSWLAPWLFTRASPRNVSAAYACIRENEIDTVWLDFPSSLGFACHLQGQRIDYFAHDVVFQRIARRPLLRLLQAEVQRVELGLLARVARCTTLSDKDAELLHAAGYTGELLVKRADGIRVGTVRGGVPVESVLHAFTGHANLVFFGNMHRPENHDSILHFLRAVYPLIRRRHPGVQFWVLGLAPRWTLRMFGRMLAGVHIVGAVNDPLPAFRAASLCVAPLLQGAGVKLKVVQMLEAGATVVASTIGAEGIVASPRLHVVAMTEFADEVCRLLDEKLAC